MQHASLTQYAPLKQYARLKLKSATRLVASSLFLFISACGGGGAIVSPPVESVPAAPAAPVPTPTAPGSTIVTTVGTTFSPSTITIAQGSTVVWQIAGATHNVTFGSVKPVGGDAPNMAAGTSVSRSFAATGTYDYQCTLHAGMTGRVLVTADGTTPVAPAPASPSGVLVQATATAFTPERVEIAPGGVVTWEFASGSGGIVFDDAAPPGGDIPSGAPGTRVSRTFATAGDFDYHSNANRDVKGRVRVQ